MSGTELKMTPVRGIQPDLTTGKDYAVCSAAFPGCTDCGLILYHLSDGKKTVLPFTDDFRRGSLYSAKISPLDPAEWAYLYYRDGRTMIDPRARELALLETAEGPVTVCRFIPEEAEIAELNRPEGALPWADRLIYCLHVKGFTAGSGSGTAYPGTFRGLADKIPYLQSLGVTDVELLPVYELYPPESRASAVSAMQERHPSDRRSRPGRTIAEAAAAYPVDAFGMPLRRDPDSADSNYWGYGRGRYLAPRRELAASGSPSGEFAEMVDALHRAGIGVILQLCFTETVSAQAQLQAARFYVTRYHVDGLRLKGHVPSIAAFAADPVLAGTAILYHGFPYYEISRTDADEDGTGGPGTAGLAEYNDDYRNLLRRFVKSDDHVMRDFMNAFLHVEPAHGQIRYVTGYEGFTLADLVTYNEKHNDDNGEGGRDGAAENFSWNCGYEGRTTRRDVRMLRLQQIRNFLTLLFLSQGTPLLCEGDEVLNSRDGNNNPWCQDNPMGWVTWNTDEDAQAILAFARAISRFRREHPVFRMRTPFRFQDYKGLGFPDISFHGTEAWKPDLGGYSHSLGIMFCENYARPSDRLELLYVAVNTYWEKVSLGLPRLPAGYQWGRVTDTSLASAFPDFRQLLGDQRSVAVRPRSIQILQAVWVGIPGQVPERVPLRGLKLPWGGKQLYTKTSADAGTRKRYLSPSNRDRIFRYAARR